MTWHISARPSGYVEIRADDYVSPERARIMAQELLKAADDAEEEWERSEVRRRQAARLATIRAGATS